MGSEKLTKAPWKAGLLDIINAPIRITPDHEFFARKATLGPALKPLGKPCHDCAVTCGFYSDYSDRLSRQSEPTRTEASLRWHCHNDPRRACRGNIDRIAGRSALSTTTKGVGHE